MTGDATGDAAAVVVDWEGLVRYAHGALLVRLMSRHGLSRAGAEDCAAEALARTWSARAKLNIELPMQWLETTAHRIAIDRWRRQRRPRSADETFTLQPLEDDEERGAGFLARILRADEPGPDELVERTETQQRVWGVLRRLPPDQARALWLHYGMGWTHSEVAAMTGARPGTTKTRIRLARAKFAAYWQASEPESPAA